MINFFWFRRDLRLEDNAGLYRALKSGNPVLPIFIFDTHILNKLPAKDARVTFIYDTVTALKKELEALGSTLLVKYGKPQEVWQQILAHYSEIAAVYTNHDYEPYAIQRDKNISNLLKSKGIYFHTYKDHVLFEKLEVTKKDGTPYTVFTPYSKKWRAQLATRQAVLSPNMTERPNYSYYLQSYPTTHYHQHFYQTKPSTIPSLADMGFEPTDITIPPKSVAQGLIRKYDKTRDFPAQEGTSRLGIHFRFGTISIRAKARKAMQLNQTFLNELIWRDFYAMILANFPYVAEGAFRQKYEHIEWRNNESEFEAWCVGKTGYPLVDAGMRQLNQTGYMHNRVRMVVASFLTKHLLIDWRWGEAYFAKKLLDFDLASNNGGWQWAAGCGTDAAPYFRVFNPSAQMKKFDKDKKYIRQWIPEYETDAYPPPIVEHKMARQRCLEVYKKGLERAPV